MKHVPEHEQLRGRDDRYLAALTPCLTRSGTIGESVVHCRSTPPLPCRTDSVASCYLYDEGSCVRAL